MRKAFANPAIDIKDLSPDKAVMDGVLFQATSLGITGAKVITDTKSVVNDYKVWKQNQ